MPQPTDFHALFVQLQSRYPTSGLLTELVHVQNGQYAVKAIVQISNTAIASAMAAAATLEQAEDQARLRVLACLGIGITTNGAVPPPPLPHLDPLPPAGNGFTPLPPPTPTPWLEQPLAGADLTPLPPDPLSSKVSLPPIEDGPGSEYQGEGIEDIPLPIAGSFAVPEPPLIADLPEAPPPQPPAAKAASDRSSSKPKKMAKAEPTTASLPEPEPEPETEAPLTEPDDLSFLIAQTDVEMDRIGWTKQQGREYLKETYNKATRQRLDADELMDFLNYLRALPSLHGL